MTAPYDARSTAPAGAAPRARPAEVVRRALILAVTLFVLLEGLRYASTGLWSAQWSVFPGVSVSAENEVVHWRSRTAGTGDATWEEVDVYGRDRRPTGWTRERPAVLSRLIASLWIGGRETLSSPLVRAAEFGPPWLPTSAWSVMRRRDPDGTIGTVAMRLRDTLSTSAGSVAWSFENGRLVARNGGVIGTLGPDGWAPGAPGPDRERFRDLLFCGSEDLETRPHDGTPRRTRVVLADRELREAFLLDVVPAPAEPVPPGAPRAAGSRPFPAFDMARVPLGGEGPVSDFAAGAYGGDVQAVLRTGNELVTFSADRRIRSRIPWGPTELIVNTWVHPPARPNQPTRDAVPTVFASSLPPIHPIGADLRLRITKDGTTTIRDVPMHPVTGAEHAVAWLRRAVAIVRPPVLSVASAFAPAKATHEAMFSTWLTDPLYAGGREFGTLALCVVLGVVCAARARATMRVQRPESANAWTLAALALGPAGLMWMRIVEPRRAVRACGCGVRRAVSVEACPACRAEWPASAANGTEVLGGAGS